MNIKPLRTEEDYGAALARIDQIFDAEPDTPDGEELEILVSLVERYEQKHYPISLPDPIEAIKIRMEDLGLKQKDLISIIGSRSHVSEILNRKRKLTVDMIRGLSMKLGLSTDVLVQSYSLNKQPATGGSRDKCRPQVVVQ
jgi:HTH-type transcriptional regulator / antitoxin HigA